MSCVSLGAREGRGSVYLRQGLNHRVQQSSHPCRHLQELQHYATAETEREKRGRVSECGRFRNSVQSQIRSPRGQILTDEPGAEGLRNSPQNPRHQLPCGPLQVPRAILSTLIIRMMVGLMGRAELISISSRVMPITDRSTMARSSWFHLKQTHVGVAEGAARAERYQLSLVSRCHGVHYHGVKCNHSYFFSTPA